MTTPDPTKGQGRRERPDTAAADLDLREREILRSVVRAHILTGAPVGSRVIAQGIGMDLSPATIRAIMADLEARGMLVQPHTSAGRVPTDVAYRVYVDRLMNPHRVAPAHLQAIDDALLRRQEISELLEEASRQLSRFSHHVGVVLAPEFRRIVVEHLEFVRLDPRRAVAVLVDRSGVVHNRILAIEETLTQEELDRIGRSLTDQFGGRTLAQMREELLARISEDRAACDRLRATGHELGRQIVDSDVADAPDVFVEGASNLIGTSDFADLEHVKVLMRTLEEKSRLVELLSRLLEGEGVQVVIGRENPVPDLASCSVIASTYRAGERVLGTVGIVGPTRMEYARAIALVDHLARVLTSLLSGTGDRGHG